MHYLSYFHGIDPAAALVHDGRVVAYVEEERLTRVRHAPHQFPIQSIRACLELGRTQLRNIDAIVVGSDAPRHASGEMARFYEEINARFPPDPIARRCQQRNLGRFAPAALRRTLEANLVRQFGIAPAEVPPLEFHPHHRSHAAAGFLLSPFDDALVLTIDGAGDSECTTIWRGRGAELEPLHRIELPHSLGWFYAAITEYLGFQADDGEYKVMGLASYGRENLALRATLQSIVRPGPHGFDYEVDPSFIHYGAHTYSDHFTDQLPALIGLPPRLGPHKLEPLHEDLAFETQRLLEDTVIRLLAHFQRATGLRTLCVSGSVGLNVKMTSRLRRMDLFDQVWTFPIPNGSGLAIGAAVAHWSAVTGKRPAPLDHLYLGPAYGDDEIEHQLRQYGLDYRRPDDLLEATAELLAGGKVLGWFQGRMEGGARALGGRSILADPRSITARERVNAALQFREYWRPFCPSLTAESAARYLARPAAAPFMMLAFDATDLARRSVPAVVHVDGTMRVQTVDATAAPRYHALLEAFERKTGAPVLLNRPFSARGEPIVCTPADAIRCFAATGLDALAIGAFLVEKPRAPLAVRPDDVLR
ncbi:MAG TPA: carbamoyltransferase C-terminal domain-containing protein [Kofleriaceae bacterium]|nr:carbamoyltransferase C-terminal domain-containing protein [Kofleriaceae bacterium]